MISPESHTREWLDGQRARFKGKDPGLIEKVIKALTLVEQLAISELDFVFKGGTALILLGGGLRRFSIDVDIIVPKKPKKLLEKFDAVVKAGRFTRWDKDDRQSSGDIHKEHYKFYFKSHVSPDSPTCILLDIVFGPAPYSVLLDTPVKSDFVKHASPEVTLRIPSGEGMLADKLAAFAPNTVGIPYGVDKDLNIAKQLFDVSRLFEIARDLPLVKKDFGEIVRAEAGYRKRPELKPRDVLDDCFDTAAIISLRGYYEKEKYDALEGGIIRLRSFLHEGIPIEKVNTWAARAALLSRILAMESPPAPRLFSKELDLRGQKIAEEKYERITRILKSDPEAFFYWQQAVGLHRALG